MRSRLTSAFAVIGAVALLLVAADATSYAATGRALLLGHRNSTQAMTTLNRTHNGPALRLHTKRASSAPLSVNGRGRVANLDADLLDGYHAGQIVTAAHNRSYVFTKNVTNQTSYLAEIPVPAGSYQFSYSNYMSGASQYAYCDIEQANPPSATIVLGMQYQSGTAYALSGAGVVSKASHGHVYFYCASSSIWTNPAIYPLQVTMTPTTVVHASTLRTTNGARRVVPRR